MMPVLSQKSFYKNDILTAFDMSAGLRFFGKEDNEEYFVVATPCCESDAAAMFNMMGKALKINRLTDTVSPGSQKIVFPSLGPE